MIWRIETIKLKTFWSLVMHRGYTLFLCSSLTKLRSPLMTHCADCLICGRSFMTFRSYCVALCGILFGLIVLQNFVRDVVHCDDLFNDIAVAVWRIATIGLTTFRSLYGAL